MGLLPWKGTTPGVIGCGWAGGAQTAMEELLTSAGVGVDKAGLTVKWTASTEEAAGAQLAAVPHTQGQGLLGLNNRRTHFARVLGMRAFIMSDKKSVNPRTNPIYDVATANNENTCAA